MKNWEGKRLRPPAYGVVTYKKNLPLWIDGPYATKKVAEEVRKDLIEEEKEVYPEHGDEHKFKVVGMTYVIPSSEMHLFFDDNTSRKG